MAHFYLSGNGARRNNITACGHKNTGIWTHTRGWDVGVHVHGIYSEANDYDVFDIRATAGSNANRGDRALFRLKRDGEDFMLEVSRPLKDRIVADPDAQWFRI